MIHTAKSLVSKGVVRPSNRHWRIRLVFLDGTDRVVCVAPGKVSEQAAIQKAKSHVGIIDDAVLDRIEASKVERDPSTPFGVVQK